MIPTGENLVPARWVNHRVANNGQAVSKVIWQSAKSEKEVRKRANRNRTNISFNIDRLELHPFSSSKNR